MSYAVESKPAPKNSWFTPAESRGYYGSYSRIGVTVHWWGGGEPASAHDRIVNYFLSQGRLGNKSVNYVISDNKITNMVHPDNVAWCSQSGNASTISFEHQPTLHAEGYKKSGWMKYQLEKRYGRRLAIYPHKKWFSTACPGSISLDKIEQECNKWRTGAYNPKPAPIPAPKPTPAPAAPVISAYSKKMYTLPNAKLVDIKTMKVIKTFPLDTPIDVGAKAVYNGKNFYLSVYAYKNKTNQGFLQGDLKTAPTPPAKPYTPPATPPAKPVPAPIPEWVANLRGIDDTKYWFTKDQDLIDIKTGKPTGTKTFKKDEEFVCSAVTKVGNVEYRITDYSYKKGVYNGVPISSLTLTEPGVPNIPPIPQVPTVEENVNWLVKAVKAILAFLKIKV